jgi:hypothetical protein
MSKRYLFIAACALALIALIGVVVAATPSPTPASETQYHYLTRWGCLGTGEGSSIFQATSSWTMPGTSMWRRVR